MKYDKIDFNADWAASVSEAAFISNLSAMAAEAWHDKEPDQVFEDLQKVYRLINPSHDNSSGNATKVRKGGSRGVNGGSSDGESAVNDGPEPQATEGGGE